MKSSKPIATHFEYDNRNKYQTAYIDEYWFGDRQLEGVALKCTLDAEGFITVEPADAKCPYLATLNEKYWVERALAFAEKSDIFYENKGLDGEELVFADEFNPPTRPQPVAVKCLTIHDVIARVKDKQKEAES